VELIVPHHVSLCLFLAPPKVHLSWLSSDNLVINLHVPYHFLPPVGPKFGNAFHDFLTNKIVAKDAISFSSNIKSFDWDFFSWFRIDPTPSSPIGINFLDTDVALAFPSLDLSVHPHFNGFTSNFAGNNTVFLATFFPALKKMSQLGVNVTLSPATSCVRCPGVVFEGKFFACNHSSNMSPLRNNSVRTTNNHAGVNFPLFRTRPLVVLCCAVDPPDPLHIFSPFFAPRQTFLKVWAVTFVTILSRILATQLHSQVWL